MGPILEAGPFLQNLLIARANSLKGANERISDLSKSASTAQWEWFLDMKKGLEEVPPNIPETREFTAI